MIRRTATASGAILTLVFLSVALPAPTARAEGRSENFQTYCTPCHGDDGKADTEQGKKKGARDLTKKKWQAKVKDERLIESVTKGRGKMPTFGKKLSEDEIKALVKEVRDLVATS
jgi:mono/diheme cytochrome c family protein